ncbi:hypothetical protein PHLCEN_2v11768 [Hermanssonia centrifuga]|uniref:Uncharacterized protein n=1 Tax=Hermanssonia centrifuga TaxID=98765 RepID=A0A2R6NK15_9APHY|nr:hypothetical protein PHLCEN_2v11768 [Hermanssonia centrifuga]
MSSLERSNKSDADHSNQTIETFIQDYFPGWFQNRDEATPQNKRWGVYLQAPTPHLQLPTGLRKSLRCGESKLWSGTRQSSLIVSADVGAASSNRTAAHQSRNQYLASLNGREMGQGSNRMELDSGESTQLVLDILMNGRPPDTNQVTDKVPTSETGDSSCAESWVDIDDEDFDANTARIENWLRGTRAALPDIDQAVCLFLSTEGCIDER